MRPVLKKLIAGHLESVEILQKCSIFKHVITATMRVPPKCNDCTKNCFKNEWTLCRNTIIYFLIYFSHRGIAKSQPKNNKPNPPPVISLFCNLF